MRDLVGILIDNLGRDSYDPEVLLHVAAMQKVITGISVGDTCMQINFNDGTNINVEDTASYCCESRCMSCDDDLESFVGAVLYGMMMKDATFASESDEDDEYDVHDGAHDIQFVEVLTSKGSFIVANHNRHNGYYGGFDIEIT